MRSSSFPSLRCLALAGVAVAAISSPAWAQDAKRQFNIQSQPLTTALEAFGKQSDKEILFSKEQTAGRTAPAVRGAYAPEEALRRLLVGSNLGIRRANANTFLVESSPQAAGTQSEPDRPTQIEEVVVTGTHIRGAQSTSPIQTYDRKVIDQSGYLSTEQFAASIPQNFSGGAFGASPDGMLGGGVKATENFEHVSSVNLRGLGNTATLTLLNGHRLAPSEYGNVVDISTVPLSAIDHIDVLTDGASAVYGADAVAGVVNIVLRRNFTGGESKASYGGAAGGLRTEILAQTIGTAWDSGSLMASYQYQHGSALPSTARSFTSDVAQPTNIINPLTQNALVVSGNQRITDRLTLSGDVFLSKKNTSAETAYTTTSAVRSFSDTDATNLHFGINYAFNEHWQVEFAGTYSRQHAEIGFNYDFGNAVPLGRPVQFITAPTRDYELNLTGTPFSLPGGDVGLALGLSHRRESLRADYDPAFATVVGAPQVSTSHRTVDAQYAELRFPFVGEQNGVPFVTRLVATAAVRRDDYSDFGRTTNPKFGVLWSPTSFLDIKANWGRSFRAPSLGELLDNTGTDEVVVYPPVFPIPSGARVPILQVFGANPHLKPETAQTYDLGFDFRVPGVPRLVLSADYYNVDFRNRIETPSLAIDILLHPEIYGQLVTQFSSDADAAAYVAKLEAQGYQLIDLGFGTSLAGVRAAFPAYLINAAVVHQDGVDVNAQYAFEIGAEAIRTSLNVAFINEIKTQFAEGATATDVANTYSNPLRFRARWEGTWEHGPLALSTAINYANSYDDPYTLPASHIASFTTVDASVAYRFANASALHGFSIRLSAVNLFDKSPPHADGPANVSQVHYDVGNASPIGRLLSVELTKNW